MRRLTSILTILIMALMMQPGLACSSSSKMSRMERDCCRQMHGRCGQMEKQGCCRVEVRTDLNQLASGVSVDPVSPVAIVAFVHPGAMGLPASGDHRWRAMEKHSPPRILIAKSTVLRI